MWMTAGCETLHPMDAAAAFAWLLTPFLSGALVVYFDWERFERDLSDYVARRAAPRP
jgi:hypothetical protein